MRGDEEAEDVGDGGPRAAGDTNEWVEGGGSETLNDEDVMWVIVGDDSPRGCRELDPVESEDVEVVVEERGIDNEDGISLVTRLVVLTDTPASCNARILSTTLPLDTLCTPFSRGGGGSLCPLSLGKICEEDRGEGEG